MLSLFKKPRAGSPQARTSRPRSQGGARPKPSLQEVLQSYNLPSFPQSVMSALRMFKDPDASLGQIAAQLERDPGISVRVLKTVNSAAFGLRKNVTHVGHAISLLGRSRVEALVVSVAVKQMLPVRMTPYFSSNHFWLLASRRASLARGLAELLHSDTATEAFTAGLLQDMAVPVLVDVHGEGYGELYKRYLSGEVYQLHEQERAALGYDHAEIGKLLATKWQLPDGLLLAIGDHHSGGGDTPILPAVHIVSDLRDSTELADLNDVVERAISYGLTEETIEELIPKAFEDADAFYQMLK